MKTIPLYPKVLIVTQQLIIAADLYIQLNKRKFHLLGICSSSNKALAAIKNQQLDIVIIDAGLKGATDGIRLGCLIAKNLEVPFIFLNPGLNQVRLKLAIAAGASAIVSTPLDIERIDQLIYQIVRKSKQEWSSSLDYYRSENDLNRSDILSIFTTKSAYLVSN